MNHRIMLGSAYRGRHACIREHYSYPHKLGGKQVGEEGPNAIKWIGVNLRVRPLEELNARNSGLGWIPEASRFERIETCILNDELIDAPVMLSLTGEADAIKTVDGRHRISVLQFLGAERIVVMVPTTQVALFLQGYG